MITHRPPPPHSPRWPVLATLVSVVLGLHLVLLAGGVTLHLPGTTPAGETAQASVNSTANAGVDAATSTASPTHRAPQALRVSTVRWIAPAPPQAPAAAPAPRSSARARAAPPPHTQAAAPPPPSVIATQAAIDTAAPSAPEAVATAPPEAEMEDVASASTPVPKPANGVGLEIETPTDTTHTIESVAPADTVLTAADSATSRAAPVKLPPALPPASTRLQYDVTGSVKGIGYRAQGTLDWSVADGRYDARMEMRVLLLGSRAQTSTGRIGPGGLMPERFSDKSRSEKAAHFDSTNQRIRFSNNAPEVPLQAGAQDRLSLFMQLAALLQARPQAYAAGQTVDMQVAGTGDAPVWRFEVGEESTIQLPAGELRVRHLMRQPRKEFDSTVEMWLAPSLDHMPVRLRVTQPNGDVADQKLSQMP